MRGLLFIVVFMLVHVFLAKSQTSIDTLPYSEGREFALPFELMDNEANHLYLEAYKAYKENDLFAAEKIINGAIKKNKTVPEYYFLKSRIQQDGNKYKKALKTVNKAVKLAPNSAAAIYNRALCKYGMKDFVGAVQDYTKVITIDPGHFESFYGRGVAKSQMDEYNSAKEDFDVAIMLKPTFAKAYYARGIALLKLQYYKDALKNLSSYTVADPKNAEALFYLGQAKVADGDISGGCSDFIKANAMGYKRAEEEASKYCIRQ